MRYKKESLVKLDTCACDIAVQVNPDEPVCDIFGQVPKNLEQLNFSVTDPFSLPFSDDFQQSPKVGLYDIFKYFISKRADFDRKSTKAYKCFEDYHVLRRPCGRTKMLQNGNLLLLFHSRSTNTEAEDISTDRFLQTVGDRGRGWRYSTGFLPMPWRVSKS